MLVGRKKEREILLASLEDDYSHFIAIYGRPRIGKTFLVRETFNYTFTFQHAGLYEGSLSNQLFAFEGSIRDAGGSVDTRPKNWLEAFEILKDLIRQSKDRKKIIFIDELSWMDTRNCDLMMALENFWNGWASARRDIVLIVCASATSWMLSKVVHNKGGLYNRLTEQICLNAFSLGECEEYSKSLGIAFNRSQILQFYMIFGGIPYYWSMLSKGLSLSQNVDRLLFADNAPLKEEFNYLFSSIFRNPTVHLRIIETLGSKKVGMTRDELIDGSGIANSGDLTTKLDELEKCGFIRKYKAFGKKSKNSLYQLIDGFTLFYYHFLANKPTDVQFWSNQINTPKINTWCGLAFERVCLLHIEQIKKALGISGVYTDINSLHIKADPDKGIAGSQIDLLIVRKDQVINLCEMKYSGADYHITEATDRSIRRKINDLVTVTGTRYAIHPTIITTYGVADNSYSGNIRSVITMDALFE